MSYRQLLANLEALPEGERQLAAGVYFFEDDSGRRVCGCVLGKGLPELSLAFEERNDFSIGSVLGGSGVMLPSHIERAEARQAQTENDKFRLGRPFGEGGPPADNAQATRLARYAHMIEWLRARVAEERQPAAQPPSESVAAVRDDRQEGKGAPTREASAPLASLAGPSHPASLGVQVWAGTIHTTAEALEAATRRPTAGPPAAPSPVLEGKDPGEPQSPSVSAEQRAALSPAARLNNAAFYCHHAVDSPPCLACVVEALRAAESAAYARGLADAPPHECKHCVSGTELRAAYVKGEARGLERAAQEADAEAREYGTSMMECAARQDFQGEQLDCVGRNACIAVAKRIRALAARSDAPSKP